MADDNGRPSARVHVTRGKGIPAVTRHWSRTLPPATTVCVDSGYNSTAGGSRPRQKCHLTLQRGVTSAARHSENVTCRGVTSGARHGACSHSFDYILTT